MTRRLAPDRPFPPYAFVPGRFPHPVSDPAGHGVSASARPCLARAPILRNGPRMKPTSTGWIFSTPASTGRRVEFESLWFACGRKGRVADFLKGLIKLAAAGVKHHDGKPPGVPSHADGAATLWREVAQALDVGQDHFLGLNVKRLVDLATLTGRQGWPDPPPLLLPEPDGSGQ